MADGDFGAVLDTFATYDANGETPSTVHVSGDIYAVAYRGSGNDGYVSTFSVDADGFIGDALLDTLEFDTGNCYYPCMIHVSGEYYAIAYQGVDDDGWLCTVRISAAGAIRDTVVDTLEFDGSSANYPSIVHVYGDYYAIAYKGADVDGYVVTVEISTTGVIPATVTDGPWEFDTDRGTNPAIIKVGGTTYAIAYSGTSYAGKLLSLTISNTGTITESALDTLTFSADNCWDCEITHVSGDYFAIAHVGSTDLSVVTVTITSAGVIPAAVTDSLVIDTSAVNNRGLSIAHVAGEYYVVAYSGTDNDGYIASVSISTGGVIPAAVEDSLEFYATDAQYPSVLADSSAVVIVVFDAGTGGPGYISTISMTTAYSFPSDALTRVTALIHRYSPGSYTLEMALGEVTSDFGLPKPSMKPMKSTVKKEDEEEAEELVVKIRDLTPPAPATEPGALTPYAETILAKKRAEEIGVTPITPYTLEVIRKHPEEMAILAQISQMTRESKAPGLTPYARQVFERRIRELQAKLRSLYRR